MSNDFEIDDIDRHIIRLLQKNGRIPFLTIANELGLAEGTIRRRVARLIDEKILQIVGVTDPLKVGMHTVAIVGLRVQRGKIDATIAQLKDMPEVRYIALATGNHDIIIEIVVPSNEALLIFLTHKLNKISWIINTGTSLVLKIAKQDFSWGTEDV
ncbi:MAG: Lrp/AsnC family transcriptional regulator [Firmicutes bacterium]|nr:Lrp/AsnC family transcriptional regulator [Bacillota bacterium]